MGLGHWIGPKERALSTSSLDKDPDIQPSLVKIQLDLRPATFRKSHQGMEREPEPYTDTRNYDITSAYITRCKFLGAAVLVTTSLITVIGGTQIHFT